MADVQELVAAVDNVVSKGLLSVLGPLVDKIKEADRKFQVVDNMLKELPEYKELDRENQILRSKI